MRVNRKIFFDEIRSAKVLDKKGRTVFLFRHGKLNGSQVSGMNDSLDVWEMRYKKFQLELLAYCMATEAWETGAKMQPIREANGVSNKSSATRLENAWNKGQMKWVKTPYWRKDKNGMYWFGRGRVQITHKRNYFKAARKLGVPIDKNPDLAMDPTISARILFSGCIDGWFTKHKLTDFIDGSHVDFRDARKVVNPKDWDTYKPIESYANAFLKALNAAVSHETDQPGSVTVGDPKPPKQKKTFFDFLASLFKRK